MWKKYKFHLIVVIALATVAFFAFRKGGWLNKTTTNVATKPSTNSAAANGATDAANSVTNGARTESEQMNVLKSFAFIKK